eukprot:3045286-Rhodomonas_salina.1
MIKRSRRPGSSALSIRKRPQLSMWTSRGAARAELAIALSLPDVMWTHGGILGIDATASLC